MGTSAACNTEVPALIIDLDQSDKNSPVPPTGLVQWHKYDELRQQVKDHLDTFASTPLDRPHPAGSGWVYFVDGTRGAGKSTFLNSVESGLKDDLVINGDLFFVARIDPSRIERSEIILLVILQRLSKQVEKVLGRQRCIAQEQLSDQWRHAFKRVAGGLSLFAREHHPLSDLDADLFLDWGLERAGDSANLRSNLHDLFAIACKALEVHAIMIAFDDADTDATHAINLLECIRKYLDTPQVMVLVTGDMELYSLLVRQHFAENLTQKRGVERTGDRSFFDRDRSSQYLRMIDHLEEQFLLKLFPMHRRLQLLPMWNLLQQAAERGSSYRVTCKAWGNTAREVQKLVDELVSRGLRVKASSDIGLYRDFLLKQPLRSVLQVLAYCAPHLAADDALEGGRFGWSRELTESLARGLRALALTNLYKFDVDTDAIAARELPALAEAVFQLSLLDGDIDTAAYLRPMSAQQEIRSCFVALAAEVPNFAMGRPGLFIRYLFTGPGSVTLYDLVRKRHSSISENATELLLGQFKRFMGVGRKETALDWARHATAVIATPYAGSRDVRIGVIGLKRGKPGAGFKLAKAAFKDASISGFPVLELALVDVSGTHIFTYASIFNILGLVERLLELDSPTLDDIKFSLAKVYPSLSLSSPVWEAGGSTDEASESGQDALDPNTESTVTDLLTTLAEAIGAWLAEVKLLGSKISPSGVFVGKVWTRLFFSLEKASDELRSKASVAEMMEIFALCVINALLVEEAGHHVPGDTAQLKQDSSADRTNPVKSASAFVKKLKSFPLSRENLPMTAIVATCPLLLGLLNAHENYAESLKGLFPTNQRNLEDINSLLCTAEHWKLFNQIAVAGRAKQSVKAVRGPGANKQKTQDVTNNGVTE
ncbi:UNVERIFIED_ORG: hypothetical protein J2W16_003041 [Pseudomonas cremoricolorata]|nr:hypothetical protein [Pseudomonas cremoricolorata]